MNVKSPLTGSNNTTWLKSIAISYIKEQYRKQCNIDVSSFFEGLKDISIYRDNDTGYCFYYPCTVAGDDKFYEKLQQFDWYYMPWKWEHQQAATLLSKGMKVLEVGCAQGSFLKKIVNEHQIEATGLELNKSAAHKANSAGLNVLTETIQGHAQQHADTYDLVCSFQVVEHIANVNSFLEAQVRVLKPGGKLIISVPNNGGFLGNDNNNFLNMPPHHMGLWDGNSLKNISNIYGLTHQGNYFEPLQEYHKDYFKSISISHLPLNNNSLVTRVYRKILSYSLAERLVRSTFSKEFKAFTIQAVYTKK
ncbi:MAG: class I SAM-dependent methyltransferase [Tunicatimonas sp.]